MATKEKDKAPAKQSTPKPPPRSPALERAFKKLEKARRPIGRGSPR